MVRVLLTLFDTYFIAFIAHLLMTVTSLFTIYHINEFYISDDWVSSLNVVIPVAWLFFAYKSAIEAATDVPHNMIIMHSLADGRNSLESHVFLTANM